MLPDGTSCLCPDGYPKYTELRDEPAASSAVRWRKHTGDCALFDELQVFTAYHNGGLPEGAIASTQTGPYWQTVFGGTDAS